MIPHDAFNVHHKLLNMYDITDRNAGLTQRWKVLGARGGNNRVFGCFSLKFTEISAFVAENYFHLPLITTVDKDFLASQVPHQ